MPFLKARGWVSIIQFYKNTLSFMLGSMYTRVREPYYILGLWGAGRSIKLTMSAFRV